MAPFNNESGEPLTFGIELECYIAYDTDPVSRPMTRPQRFASHPGRPIVVAEASLVEICRELFGAILSLFSGSMRRGICKRRHVPWHYQEWDVKPDGSLRLHHLQLREGEAGVNGWQGVEIVSPVLLANRHGFNEVLQVVEFIRNNFWVESTRAAGLHIHVGNGGQWFPTESLRSMGAFLYSADPVLAQLHARHRRENYRYAPSNRYFSRLSFGMTVEHHRRLAGELAGELEEPPASTPIPWWNFWPKPAPAFRRASVTGERVRENFPPRPTETAYTAPEHDNWIVLALIDVAGTLLGRTFNPETYTPIPMQEAVRELLLARRQDTLAELLRAGNTRAAYNFNGHLADHHMLKTTVEFRQPASTIDSAAIICQASIALGICEFCCNADDDDLLKIVADLTVAENEPEFYDVYDLLLDLGLAPEARLVRAISDGAVNHEEAGREYLRDAGVVLPGGLASLFSFFY